jgi:NAD+ kinase
LWRLNFKFMRIAIFANTYRAEIVSSLDVIFQFFKQRDAILLFEKELYAFIKEKGHLPSDKIEIIDSFDFEADLVLSIGGDGTFLNSAARVGRKQIPILGINSGSLGFLADIPKEDILPALEAIVHNQFWLEDRTLLYIESSDGTSFEYPYVLNEIAILKQEVSSMISVSATVNGQFVHTYRADGLVVSTPTGSTAYSLSVGGPIVMPQAENIIIAPIATHSLNVRPLVIPDSWIIDLEVGSRNECFLVALDGRSQMLNLGTRLRISKADYTIKVVKQLDHTFFDTLKNKLMWGVDKRS